MFYKLFHIGLSKASKISDSVTTRDPVDPPRDVECAKVNRTNLTLQWRRPEYDGGCAITGYIVEKRDLDLPDGRWMKCNFSKVIKVLIVFKIWN